MTNYKYFKIKNIHIFVFLSFKRIDIQFGTIKKSYNIVLAREKMRWHNGPITLTIAWDLHLPNFLGYEDPSIIDNWCLNHWRLFPIFGWRKKFPISSEELILSELMGENNWDDISQFKDLTLAQIEEFRDKVNWNIISTRYKMDLKFIERNKDKIIWNKLVENRKISKKLKEKVLKNILNFKGEIL